LKKFQKYKSGKKGEAPTEKGTQNMPIQTSLEYLFSNKLDPLYPFHFFQCFISDENPLLHSSKSALYAFSGAHFLRFLYQIQQ